MDFFLIIISLVSTILVFLLIGFSCLAFKIYSGQSLNNPQYPPVLGTVFHQIFHFTRLYDYHTDVARNFPTFRLLAPSQSEVYTTDARNIEHVLRTNFDNYSKGDYNQTIVKDLFGCGIFSVDGDMWRQQRKLASFEFSTRVLRDFSCVCFRKHAADLANIISEFTITGAIFDMKELLARCTMDSIFKVGFGVDLNCLGGSYKEGDIFIKALDDANESIFWRYADPFWRVKRYFNIGSEAILRNNIKVLDEFVYGVISSRRKLLSLKSDCKEKEDILSRFLVASEKDPSNMTDKYLRDIILSFIVAGKDSTANTMSWFYYMLSKHPVVQEKIVQEISDVSEFKNDTSNIEEFAMSVSDAMLEKMHYLHAALSETLRLYPGLPVDGRCANMDDILPDGNRLKKGDGIYYLAYAMGRMPYIWGDDAEEFRPERWLNKGVFQPESPFKFVAFHAGPRTCLGKDSAYRQMKIVATVLLRFFRFKLADEKKQVTYRTMLTLPINGGLHLKAVPRLGEKLLSDI